MSADLSKHSTGDLCKRIISLAKDRADPLSLAAIELAWRVATTLEQDLLGAANAISFLKAFPDD